MSKKPDPAEALSRIIRGHRGDDPDTPPAEASPEPSPPPAPPAGVSTATVPTTAPKGRGGKSSDTATYSQYSVYLKKDTRKKVGRALDDAETGQDFSDLVQSLLEQWLASRT